MKVTVGVMFGCALWLQCSLGYNRARCGVVARRVHVNVCASGAASCREGK